MANINAKIEKPEKLLLRAKEAAAVCGLAESTWWQMTAAGKVPPSIRLGRARLWEMRLIRKWTQLGCPSREKFQSIIDSEGAD